MSAKPLLRRALTVIAVALFWLGLWFIAAQIVDQELFVPSPRTVAHVLWSLLPTAEFWKSVGLSLLRICIGYAAALLVGSLLAVLTARFTWIRTLLSPLLHIVRAAPVASFIIITLVFVGKTQTPTFIAFLMVLPLVWLNVEQGIREIDPQLTEVARLYRFSFGKRLKKLYLPSVQPFFLAAAVNGLGFAWKSGVAAEVICNTDLSIGGHLSDARYSLEYPEVFAWTAVVILLSLLLERVLLRVTATARKKGGERHGRLG